MEEVVALETGGCWLDWMEVLLRSLGMSWVNVLPIDSSKSVQSGWAESERIDTLVGDRDGVEYCERVVVTVNGDPGCSEACGACNSWLRPADELKL